MKRVVKIYELLATNEQASFCVITPPNVYSLLNLEWKNASITTIKNLCDGLDMTLGDFFSSPEFDDLEQEIK